MILRYETECRELVSDDSRAREVRALRVDSGYTWRDVDEECRRRWATDVGDGDTQSLGSTLCHVAAEVLAERADAEPWN